MSAGALAGVLYVIHFYSIVYSPVLLIVRFIPYKSYNPV